MLFTRAAHGANGLRLSRLFRTPSIGGPSGQPPFVNAVAAMDTLADPWQVWQCIRDIERKLGRERNQRWEARKIDLDILLFDDLRIWTPQLKIPHPRMAMRRFILIPGLDVASDWRDPVTGMSIQQLADNLNDGAASLVLMSHSGNRPARLLQQAAAQAMASWIDPIVVAPEQAEAADRDILQLSRSKASDEPEKRDRARWVGQVSCAALDAGGTIQLIPEPKLKMFLADPVASDDVAWEDYHRQLAQRLGLMEISDKAIHNVWSLVGPRYLLASDDPEWAVHEMVAALEAMDCPIEPMTSS